MLERCPRCGLQFERVEGHLTGALGVNTVVSIIAVFVVGIVGFILTYPELPLLPLTGAVVAAAIVVPLLCYPVSKTIWTAVDLRMRPLEPDEVADGYGEWIQF